MTGPRQPPYSEEAEQSVLGGLLVDNALLDQCLLVPEDFFRSQHQEIYSAIRDMVKELQRPCDAVTLWEHMLSGGTCTAGDATRGYLLELQVNCFSVSNFRAYAEIVREHATRRQIIGFAAEAGEAGYKPDGRTTTEIVADLMMGLDKLQRRKQNRVRTFAEVIELSEASIARAATERKAGRMPGAPTGVPCIDRRTGGLVAPRFWLIAGRPSLGKSAMLNQWAMHAARHDFPGYIASLEMDEAEIGTRARANAGKVNVTRLAFGGEEEREKSLPAAAELGRLPIYVDTGSEYLPDITAQIVLARMERGIKWAAVDNLQLVEVDGRLDMREKLSIVSRTLKKLTIKLGIPIVAVSHLNRSVEKDRRKPTLADLKESGSLEQDADIVCFLHSGADDDKAADKVVEIGFGKNRGGRKGWCHEKVIFRGATQTFVEIDEDHQQQDQGDHK